MSSQVLHHVLHGDIVELGDGNPSNAWRLVTALPASGEQAGVGGWILVTHPAIGPLLQPEDWQPQRAQQGTRSAPSLPAAAVRQLPAGENS